MPPLDPSTLTINIVCIIALIALSAFFSSSETALVSCNRIRIRSMVDENDRRLKYLNLVLDNQSKMLAAILIGNNIVNLYASSLTTTLALKLGGSYTVSLATGILTFLILVFGEISPKTAATIHAEKLALFVAPMIHILMVVLTPVIFIINTIAGVFLRLMGINPDQKQEAITEDELRTFVDVSHEEGVIEKEELKMINNVVDFGDSLAKDVMVPRIDMIFADINATYEELIDIYRTNMFTRLPVYENTTDNVIGMINMKDLLLYRPGEKFHLRDYLREAYYTYEYKKTSELFIDMRQHYVSMAIVLDEYGATAGLVALEDLLEEIVGEIRDEYDADELDSVQKISDTEYLVEGSVRLDDLNDMLDIHLESEDYDSIGGYIIGLLDNLPKVGQSVSEGEFKFHVESLDKNRIKWVRLWIPEPKEEKTEEEETEGA
ncbi:MAG: HlyC/CorC family transporter [Lachnospiraceae bacterium]|nr:HlyC/CorC family transporter [Lachnospiraceae bacterium]